MKRLQFLLIAVLITSLSWAKDKTNGEEVKLTPPEEYALQKPATRAFGKGTAVLEHAAKQMAVVEARAQFSQALETAILSATESMSFNLSKYLSNGNTTSSSHEGAFGLTDMVKTISQNIIKGTDIVKIKKYFVKKSQLYNIYVCIEYRGEPYDLAQEVVKNIRSQLPLDERESLDSELDNACKIIEDKLINSDEGEVTYEEM